MEKKLNRKDVPITSKIKDEDWIISDSNVVRIGELVGEDRYIEAVNSGLSLIMVRYNDQYSYRILVYVKDDPPPKETGIRVELDDEVEIGDQILSRVWVDYENGESENVTFESDYEVVSGKSSLIKGTSIGSFKGINEGEAVVEIRYGNFTQRKSVKVVNKPVDIYMLPEEQKVLENQITEVKVKVLYKNGASEELNYGDSVNWRVSDEDLVSKLDTLDGKLKVGYLPEGVVEKDVEVQVEWRGLTATGILKVEKDDRLEVEKGNGKLSDTICITKWKFD